MKAYHNLSSTYFLIDDWETERLIGLAEIELIVSNRKLRIAVSGQTVYQDGHTLDVLSFGGTVEDIDQLIEDLTYTRDGLKRLEAEHNSESARLEAERSEAA